MDGHCKDGSGSSRIFFSSPTTSDPALLTRTENKGIVRKHANEPEATPWWLRGSVDDRRQDCSFSQKENNLLTSALSNHSRQRAHSKTLLIPENSIKFPWSQWANAWAQGPAWKLEVHMWSWWHAITSTGRAVESKASNSHIRAGDATNTVFDCDQATRRTLSVRWKVLPVIIGRASLASTCAVSSQARFGRRSTPSEIPSSLSSISNGEVDIQTSLVVVSTV
ncbi:hypothetical protein BU23DRAFT_569448 [Bimuria novae-zelandiae CBS 107.79]|uniref:Uncharacterized protein n=1 Tax=Bimuria novae-zelandiae CBS 107.79 TaxID=1447943 RepID=A0A6A5V4J0_9PLEO|nr:hypothetical protein BU23DRAFT_569448 [Bimuria novae-zelandiae CBS 107.79]